MTSSNELRNKLKCLDSFLGVFPCDLLPELKNVPCSIIVNTDKHDQRGEHWVAIYINSKRIGYYFDSYGLQPLNSEIEDYLNSNTNGWKWFNHSIQGVDSIKCGQFSVLFILMKELGYTLNQITNLFTDNSKGNDFIAQQVFDYF